MVPKGGATRGQRRGGGSRERLRDLGVALRTLDTLRLLLAHRVESLDLLRMSSQVGACRKQVLGSNVQQASTHTGELNGALREMPNSAGNHLDRDIKGEPSGEGDMVVC